MTLLLVHLVAVAALPAPAAGQPADAEPFYEVPIAGSPARGASEPLVTIVELTDYQCPFCGRVVETLRRVLEHYPGIVRHVHKDNPLPFHDHAQIAAEAARAAGAQGRFWEMHDKLFTNQRALERADLERYAAEIGLDLSAFRRSIDQGQFRQEILQDQELATRLGARGTPSFFINGRLLVGAQPFERFQAVIDAQIVAASRLLGRGVARRDLYAELTRGGLSRAADPPPSPAPTPTARTRPDPAAMYRVEIGASPRRGQDDALVTIVEWIDYQCPFSARVQDTIRQVEQEYGSRVRIVAKMNPLPFHPEAMPAAEAALAAQAQGLFWEMDDRLFQAGLARTLGRATYEQIAAEIGMNTARFRAELDAHTYAARIQEEQALAAQLGARGTPAFFVNGRYLAGAQPIDAFRRVIDEEERRARAFLRQRRVPAGRLYDLLTLRGLTAPVLVPEPAAVREEDRVFQIAVPRAAPARGPAGARVVIQEFADFQCPFSSRVQATLRDLELRYPGRIRIVWRHFPLPFHTDAMLAHEAAAEAHAQGHFWEYHDLLFANQRALSRDDLVRYAREVGLDVARFQAALDAHTHRATIDADLAASRESGAAHGTPSFFIDGRLLQGAQQLSAFEAAVDAALRRR